MSSFCFSFLLIAAVIVFVTIIGITIGAYTNLIHFPFVIGTTRVILQWPKAFQKASCIKRPSDRGRVVQEPEHAASYSCSRIFHKSGLTTLHACGGALAVPNSVHVASCCSRFLSMCFHIVFVLQSGGLYEATPCLTQQRQPESAVVGCIFQPILVIPKAHYVQYHNPLLG